MATRRRRTISRRTTRSSRPSLPAQAVSWLVNTVAETISEATDDQRRDGAGLLLGGGALAIVASMVWPSPDALAWLHGLTLWLVGYGWPLLVAGMAAGAFLLIHPSAAKHLQRLQGVAAAVAVVAMLGLLSLASRRAGGALGDVVASLATRGLGGRGAAIALVLLLAAMLLLSRQARLATTVRQALRHPSALLTRLRSQMTGVRVSAREKAEAGEEVGAPAATAPLGATAGEIGEALPQEPSAEPVKDGAADVTLRSPAPERETRRSAPVVDRPAAVLLESPAEPVRMTPDEARSLVQRVEGLLEAIDIKATVKDVVDAPSSILVALELALGVRVAKLKSAMVDLQVGLSAPNLLLRTPIPGTSYIGLEIPRETTDIVRLRAVVEAPEFWSMTLPLALGAGPGGKPVLIDLAEEPHVTIGGATGSGKSVGMNSLILGLTLRHGPDTLWMALIDPKKVELATYAELPHLAMPVVTDSTLAQAALQEVVAEMDRRYTTMKAAGAKNIAEYNEGARGGDRLVMPYLVVAVDELASLMMVTEGAVEGVLVRIAQEGRAAGVHLIIATQTPRKEVMTGVLKANVPGRIAFAVGSALDSRVIFDATGAEQLKGKGDMLVTAGSLTRARVQGAFSSKADIMAVTGAWSAIAAPGFFLAPELANGPDPMFARAARKIVGDGRDASAAVFAATLQGALSIPRPRALRLVDQLAEHGVVGTASNGQSREVLMDGADVDELLERLGIEGGPEPARESV